MANQFQPLLDGMEQGLKDILNTLIDGTVEDLDGPIREISARLTMAARRNRPDLVEACKDQLQLVVLEKELRLRSEADGFLDTFLSMGINALISGAVGGLGSLRF
jgi:hypothetical protein